MGLSKYNQQKQVYGKSKARAQADSQKRSSRKPQHVVVERQKIPQKIPRSAFGKGNSMMIAMPFTTSWIFDTGASPTVGVNYAQRSYRLNSVTLPFVGQIAGNQLPQHLNSVINNFKNYKVLAAKVKIECYKPTAGCRVGMFAVNSEDINDLGASTTVVKSDLKKNCWYMTCDVDGDNKAVMSRYFKIGQIEGLNKTQFEGDMSNYIGELTQSVSTATARELTPTLGHLPMKHPLVHFAIAPTANAQATVRAKLDIIYYVKVFNKMSIPSTESTI